MTHRMTPAPPSPSPADHALRTGGGRMIQVDTRPEDVGLSTARLARIAQWMRRWVDSGKLPGLLVAVVRDDRLAWFETCGHRDVESGRPVEPDTIYRIYSMTKPITTVAAMMLYEEGRFQLDDPIERFIPAFAGTKVFASGDADAFTTVPLARPITVHDLMTHTSGLTYGFQHEHAVDALYRRNGIEFNANVGPLAEVVEAAAAQPLVFQPGARWNYSVSTDVLGRLVEIWSGDALDTFFAQRIFGPLGMLDTGFRVPDGQGGRLASNYAMADDGGAVGWPRRPCQQAVSSDPASTFRGRADRLHQRRTISDSCGCSVDHGAPRRHPHPRAPERRAWLPRTTARRLVDMGPSRDSRRAVRGIGFGLGVSVMLDPARARILGSPGEYAWGGMASTAFWVDPAEDLIVLLLTQLMPSSAYPIRRELRALTYQALL